MSDSYHRTVLPLAQNQWLSDKHLNVNSNLTLAQKAKPLAWLGIIYMDLDALTGTAACKHTGESVMTVAAPVDRIYL